MFFNKHVCTVALFAVLIIDHRIVEGVHMARSFPGGGVHKDGRIDADNIVLHAGHAFPPEALKVIFQLYPVGAVVVYRLQAVVNFGAWVHKAILFGVGDDIFQLGVFAWSFCFCHRAQN